MRRVCHLVDDLSLGGVTRMIGGLVDAPALQAFEQRIVATDRLGALQRELCRADVLVVHFSAAWAKLPLLLALRVMHPKQQWILVEHSYCKGFETNTVPAPGRFRTLLRTAYALFDRVVAVSQGQRMWMLETRLAPASKITVIQPHIDYDRLLRLPRIAPSHVLRIGALGRFSPSKGFDTLLEAMRLLAGRPMSLVLGGFGEEEARLRRLAQDLPNVHFTGRVDAVDSFLSTVDVLVVPSRWETFGIVAAEARAAGRPVVVAPVDGLVEQADAEQGGWVLADGSPKAIARMLEHLARREDLAEAGARARRRVINAYTTSVSRWRVLFDDARGASGIRRWWVSFRYRARGRRRRPVTP
jgi:D-inositol-3-phosphate glycosyltransferase